MAQLTTKGRLETKPEQLRDPQVGIVGGCLSTGSRNVGLDSVYHRIVRREIREMTGIEIRFRLARQDVANTQVIRAVVTDLIDGKKVNCVVFSIRPYLNLGLQTLVWRKLGTHGIRGLALNPYCFPGANGSPGSGSLFPVVRWAKLNLALGNLFGLGRLHDRVITELLRDLKCISIAARVQLIVLGPLMGRAYPEPFRRAICRRCRQIAAKLDLDYLDFTAMSSSASPEHFAGDGIHLTAVAHRLLADVLGVRLRKRLIAQC